MQNRAKLLIIDDEIKVINSLNRIFDKDIFEVLIASEPEDVLTIIENQELDIIICDYNMPLMSGIDVLKYSKKIRPRTVRILITGNCDLDIAISAINEGSIYYYISKPWKNEEVLGVVKKALDYKRDQDKKALLYEMLDSSQKNLDEMNNRLKSVEKMVQSPSKQEIESVKEINCKKIPVREDENIILIDPKEILYITAENSEINVVTKRGIYKSRDSLNKWEENLDDSFFRCHRSYIVNIDKIEKIIPWFNSAYNIELKGLDDTIPVSRSAMKILKEELGI